MNGTPHKNEHEVAQATFLEALKATIKNPLTRMSVYAAAHGWVKAEIRKALADREA